MCKSTVSVTVIPPCFRIAERIAEKKGSRTVSGNAIWSAKSFPDFHARHLRPVSRNGSVAFPVPHPISWTRLPSEMPAQAMLSRKIPVPYVGLYRS